MLFSVVELIELNRSACSLISESAATYFSIVCPVSLLQISVYALLSSSCASYFSKSEKHVCFPLLNKGIIYKFLGLGMRNCKPNEVTLHIKAFQFAVRFPCIIMIMNLFPTKKHDTKTIGQMPSFFLHDKS